MIKPAKRKIATSVVTDDDISKRPCPDTIPSIQANAPDNIFKKPTTSAPVPVFTDAPPSPSKEVILQGGPPKLTLNENQQSLCNIASLEAKNYTQTNYLSCRLNAYKRDEKTTAWSAVVLTKISFIAANQDWTVIASQAGDFFCYDTPKGLLHLSLRLESPISRIILCEHYAGVLNKNDQVVVWDLKEKREINTHNLPHSVKQNHDRLSSLFLSSTGLPVITLKNGEIFFYSRLCKEWRQIQSGIDMLSTIITHLEFIQKVVPGGLISKVVLNQSNLKLPTIASSFNADDMEDEQIALLLSALDELNYPEEYMLLASVYVNRLVAKGKIARLYGYIEETLNNLTPGSQIDLDILRDEIDQLLEKHALVKQSLADFQNQVDDGFTEDLGFLS
ncbi:Protein HIR [Aphelenchoides bicaudatus]|nr:Protein HIR [Aphelenchoides bicaudatus]